MGERQCDCSGDTEDDLKKTIFPNKGVLELC